VLLVQAPAKINLSLEVIGRRPDGFHELVSVMQTIDVYDVLHCEYGGTIEFSCDDPTLSNGDNSVVRAATRLRDAGVTSLGCTIHLKKSIPIAAGLGGGSSDAAAALFALAQIWDLDLVPSFLDQLAADLGSDVPFFMRGGTCLIEGRGERVTSLHCKAPAWYVLANPRILVSTEDIYHAMSESEWSNGSMTRRLAADLSHGAGLRIGMNSLQSALFRMYPAACDCFDEMNSLTPGNAIVSGSGPTTVGIFDDEMKALHARNVLRNRGYWTVIAHPHQRKSTRAAEQGL
jgi:4-diphosphocytidyl-2-C-methyl-D-erythritol kinase